MASIKVSPPTATVAPGKSATFTASQPNVGWTVDPTNAGPVTSGGNFTAASPASVTKCKVVATSKDGKAPYDSGSADVTIG